MTTSTVRPVRLRPRMVLPLAMMGTSVFFCLIVGKMIGFGVAWDPWWVAPITLLLAGLAVMYLCTGVMDLASRGERAITIEEQRFTFLGVTTTRESVSVVRYDSDFMFKGVRVDRVDGSVVRVPAGTYRPGKVLAAFRRKKYPVELRGPALWLRKVRR